jgi:hypothetical protein
MGTYEAKDDLSFALILLQKKGTSNKKKLKQGQECGAFLSFSFFFLWFF